MNNQPENQDALLSEIASLRMALAKEKARGDRLAASLEERASREMERFLFRELLNNMAMVILRCDREGWITDCWGKGFARWGYDARNLLGANINDTYPEGRGYLRQAEETGRRVDYIADGTLDDGSVWAFQSCVFQDAGNPDGGYIYISLDITDHFLAERKKRILEAKMQQGQKLESLGVMAGGIAHDFNNLLTGILGNAELAQLDVAPDSTTFDCLEGISQAALRAADLCKQMLAYAGKGRYVVEILDLNHLLGEMSNLLEVSVSKKVRLKFQPASDPVGMEGDPTQLRQLILSLVNNAAEAIGDRTGDVSISTGVTYLSGVEDAWPVQQEMLPEGWYAWFEVCDSGSGMPDATLKRIFEPFFTTRFTGRGLGLSAAMGIVRGHHGAIGVSSTEGEGSCFRVWFPKMELMEKPSETALKSEPQKELTPGVVLLVDDEQHVRTVAGNMLRSMGFSVIESQSGKACLEQLAKYPVDLVMLDLTMPDLSGEETFRELRLQGYKVPVLLCSGYHQDLLSDRFQGLDFAGYLQKPYRQATLKQYLSDIFRTQSN